MFTVSQETAMPGGIGDKSREYVLVVRQKQVCW